MDTRRISRRRMQRAFLIEVWLRRAPAVLAVLGLFLLGGWFMALRWDADMVRCLHEYDRAHTAADTAWVDAIAMGGKNPRNGHNCGRLRREGTLDRHRRAMEQRRAAAAKDGRAVIEN